MENLRNRIDVKLVRNEKYYLKHTSKPSYISHKIFYNDLVVIRKSKLILTRNKPAYVGMCVLDLYKMLMYYSHMILLKINMVTTQGYFIMIQTIGCMKLKLKAFMKILVRIKKCLILVIILLIHTYSCW